MFKLQEGDVIRCVDDGGNRYYTKHKLYTIKNDGDAGLCVFVSQGIAAYTPLELCFIESSICKSKWEIAKCAQLEAYVQQEVNKSLNSSDKLNIASGRVIVEESKSDGDRIMDSIRTIGRMT
jgi:hypothetical protein